MRPLLALMGLVMAAILAAAIVSQYHQVNRLPAPGEEERQEIEKVKGEMEKKIKDPNRLTKMEKVKEGAIRATLEIEGKGTMTLELYPKAAPKTVAHITSLIKQNFYEGILFHRVVPAFVAQGGDPASKGLDGAKMRTMSQEDINMTYQLGNGGSGKTVPLEADYPHVPYSIGLARSTVPDSGDSQFYINLKDNVQLDDAYCIFGMVVTGREVADKLEPGDKIKRFTIP